MVEPSVRGLLLAVVVVAAAAVGLCSAADGGCLRLPCCMPDQWQGIQRVRRVASDSGTYFTSETTAEVTYDAVNEREVYTANKTDGYGNTYRFQYYAFYKIKVGFFYNLNTGKCERRNLQTFEKRCVPDNFEVADRRVTLGGGYSKVTGTRVSYEQLSGATTVYGQLLVVSGCVPITDTKHSTQGSTFRMSQTTFEDVTTGIASEDVFTLPSACQRLSLGR